MENQSVVINIPNENSKLVKEKSSNFKLNPVYIVLIILAFISVLALVWIIQIGFKY